MDLRSKIHIEIVKNDRLYTFIVPTGAPLGESYDAVFEVLQYMVKLAQQNNDQLTPHDKNPTGA